MALQIDPRGDKAFGRGVAVFVALRVPQLADRRRPVEHALIRYVRAAQIDNPLGAQFAVAGFGGRLRGALVRVVVIEPPEVRLVDRLPQRIGQLVEDAPHLARGVLVRRRAVDGPRIQACPLIPYIKDDARQFLLLFLERLVRQNLVRLGYVHAFLHLACFRAFLDSRKARLFFGCPFVYGR